MLGLVRSLAQQAHVAVIVVLHDLNAAAAYCDHIVCLAGGKVAAAGSVAEVYTDTTLSDIYGWPISVSITDDVVSVHPARRYATTSEADFLSLVANPEHTADTLEPVNQS